jgi:hypothetical protein
VRPYLTPWNLWPSAKQNKRRYLQISKMIRTLSSPKEKVETLGLDMFTCKLLKYFFPYHYKTISFVRRQINICKERSHNSRVDNANLPSVLYQRSLALDFLYNLVFGPISHTSSDTYYLTLVRMYLELKYV